MPIDDGDAGEVVIDDGDAGEMMARWWLMVGD